MERQPLASMCLTDEIHKGEKLYFCKNRNYLQRAKRNLPYTEVAPEDVVLRLTLFNQVNTLCKEQEFNLLANKITLGQVADLMI